MGQRNFQDHTCQWACGQRSVHDHACDSESSKVNTIETIFDNIGAVIKKTTSKKGTYVSVSVNVVMKSPDAVIEKYKEVGRLVDGVISL